MYKVPKRFYAFLFFAVVLAIAASAVRTVLAENARTGARGAREAASFYRAVRMGMSRSEIERRARASNLWTYDSENYAVYRSRSWFQSVGCEQSVNVRVDYDSHARATKIGPPKTYVTACM